MLCLAHKIPDRLVTGKHPSSFGSIAGTLNHAYVVDLIWQAHLQGREHGFTSRNTEREPPIDSLMTNQTALDRWYVDYADDLSETAHDDVLQFRFVDGGAGAMSRGEMLLHVVNHKTYHRGNVANLLHHAGINPPVMDLPVFLRDAFGGRQFASRP
jgi:uncharacterized damage-inducible protein DinB